MKTLIVAEENWPNRTPTATYEKVKLKFVADGFEPRVAVLHEGDKSNGDELTLCIYLSYGLGMTEFREFEASGTLPLAAVLKRCLFDLEGFMGKEDTTKSAFYEALDYAINALGSLQFYIEDGEAVAKLTFYNRYIYFVLNEENTAFFFEKA